MATAAFQSVISRAGQTSTPFVNSTAGALGGFPFGSAFQINIPSQRLLDPNVVPTVQIDEGSGFVAPAPGRATIDYLFGIIRFNPALTLLNCRVSGSALNLLPIFEVQSYEFTLSRELLDSTSFDSNGVKQYSTGLMTASGSLEALSVYRKDGGVAGDKGPEDLLDSGENFLVSIQSGLSTPKGTTRLWAKIENVAIKGEVGGMTEHMLKFTGASPRLGVTFSRFVD